MSEMLEAATFYRKNGFNDEDAAQLAKVSAMFSNVADEEISAGDAADFIISQLIAFNQVGDNTIGNAQHIADAINEVANRFSVSSGDLSKGLSVVASSSAAMGNSMEQTIGLMTAITEQTRNANKASRGLNSIMANLAQVLDDSSTNGKKIVEIFKQLNVEMYENGQLKSGYDLLSGLSDKWGELDSNSQKYIATTIAGTTQLNNFLALMNNFDHATKATNVAINSQGSAINENSKYMEHLEAKLTSLRSTFQDFSNNIIDSDITGGLLDLANTFLKIANTDFGTTITQIALLTSAISGGTALFSSRHFLPVIGNQFKTFFDLITKGSAATAASLSTAGKTVTSFGAVMSGILPVIAGISIAAVVGVNIYEAWKNANPTLEEASNKLSDVNTELTSNRDRLNEINQLQWDELTPEIINEKNALEQENDELERQIALLEKRKLRAAQKEAHSGGVISTGEIGYTATYIGDTISGFGSQGFDTYEELVEYLENYIPNASKKTREELESLGVQFGEVSREVYVNGEEYNNHLIGAMEDYIAQLTTSHELNVDQIDDYNELINNVGQRVLGLKAEKEQTGEITEQDQKLIDVYNQLISAYDNASEIAEIHRHSIEITSDSYDKLIDKYPQLNSAVKDVNGTLYLDVNALSAVETETFNAKKSMIDLIAQMTVFNNTGLNVNDKIQALTSLAASAGASSGLLYMLNSISKGEKAGLAFIDQYGGIEGIWNYIIDNIKEPKKIVVDTGDRGLKTKKSPVEKSKEVWKNQLDLLKDRLEIIKKSGGSEEEQIAQMRKIQDAVHKQADEYRRLGLSDEHEYIRELGILWWDYENDIKDIYKNVLEESEKAAEQARKIWEDDLNKQKSDYEIAASYVVDKIQEEIDNLQSLRDDTEEYYDAKIQAIKDSNDELDKQIEYEELLNKLSQSKQQSLYVFKDGRFQYIKDADAISSAQADLDAYERERTFEQEVANLEKLKDDALASIDDQIVGWEEYKDEWSNVVQQYTDEQNKLIAEQILGIDLEQKNWEERLINAKDFANSYNNIMANLSIASQEGSVSGVGGSAQMTSSDLSALAQAGRDYNNASTDADRKAAHDKAESIRAKYGYSGGEDGSQYIKKYAVGTTYASGGLSLVGERGAELRVLNQGDGVIPSDITKNLWDWGKISPSTISNGISQVFNIDNISLPGVKDAQSFVSGLKQMAYQRAYRRA